jgi:hypothetical protein
MTPEEIKEFTETFGKQAAEKMQSEMTRIETALEKKHADVLKGKMEISDFEKFKEEKTAELNGALKEITKLQDVAKEQGNKINAMIEHAPAGSKSLEDWIIEQKEQISDLRATGKMMEITATQLKAAGITSIGNTVQDMTMDPGNSPYLPGIGAGELRLFDIVRNPNYIVNHVDIGRTNQSRLAWINETEENGDVAIVEEGAVKPLLDMKFKVEISRAKKIAGYVKITEEFEDDLPQLATRVRRMLNERVLRFFDDAIQIDVLANARPFEITGMDGDILDANLWDAVYAMMAQIRSYNYEPNTVGINPNTEAKMKMLKATDGTYLLPSFADEIRRLQVLANKLPVNHALVGDLKQFKVDIYKEFVLKVGWVNDDFIRNQFAVVGEMRFHTYISDIRKKAIAYSDLGLVINQIDGNQGS